MATKPKRPKSKSVAKSARKPAGSARAHKVANPNDLLIKSQPLSRRTKKIILGLIILFVVIAAFPVYVNLAYDSFSGFRYAHQHFPGANSAAVSAGRASANAYVKGQVSDLTNLENVEQASVQPQQWDDYCAKGEHQFAIAGATEDNFAYTCKKETITLVTYTAPVCQVAAALVAADITFTTDPACGAQVPKLQQGIDLAYFDGSKYTGDAITVYTKARTSEQYTGKYGGLTHCFGSGRTVVYCKSQNVAQNLSDEPALTSKLFAAFPANTQAVVAVTTGSTYYQK